jgi:hypothetical protein
MCSNCRIDRSTVDIAPIRRMPIRSSLAAASVISRLLKIRVAGGAPAKKDEAYLYRRISGQVHLPQIILLWYQTRKFPAIRIT